MSKKYLLIQACLLLFFVSLSNILLAQNTKALNKLTNAEYQKLKVEGKLSLLYPEQFQQQTSNAPLVLPKQLPQNPTFSGSKSKPISNFKKYKSNGAATIQSMQTVGCGTLNYEPPITTPVVDLNGDIVTDTIVQFTNGTAPEYRNDDGSSPALTLPFLFCFYGTVINAPGSANQNFYINNNGNISFANPYSTFSPPNFPAAGFTMIGGFFGDVDTRLPFTPSNDPPSGLVYMRRMPHYAVFKWDNVGYFNSQTDKRNSFMIVISDGTSPIIPDGLNAAIFYGDMNWTTGSASQGVNGFGGIAAIVGANAGDGVNFLKIGRFDHAGIDYDGPNGANDGVDWLDSKNFYFSACGSSTNLAPVALGLNICDTLSVCTGDTFNFDFTYIGPEFNQNVTITIVPPTNPTGFTSSVDYSAPNAPIGHISYFSPVVGLTTFQVFATDNASPPLSSNLLSVTLQSTLLDGSATSTNAGCMTNNGSIAFNLNSGSPPYSLSLDSGITFTQASSVSNLAGGIYHVQLKDVGGCKIDTLITITQPTPPVFDSLGFNNVPCNGQFFGSAAFSVTGQTNSFFQYVWHVPNPPPITDSVCYGLQANTSTNPFMDKYWFVAIDTTNHCRDSVAFRITEPSPLVIDSIPTSYIFCQGTTGTLKGYASGGTQYTIGAYPHYNFEWLGVPPTYQNADSVFNVVAGDYTLLVTDTNNCSTTGVGTLKDGSLLNHNLIIENATCHGVKNGTAFIQLSGGVPPYDIVWHIFGLPKDSVHGIDADSSLNLGRNNNFVVLYNKNKCIQDTIKFTITEPDTLSSLFTTINSTCQVAKNGAVNIDVNGGVPPYTYLWSTDHDKTSQAISGLKSDTYSVLIKDKNNCEIISTVYLPYDSNFVITSKPDFVYDAVADNSLWANANKPANYTYHWSNGSMLDDSLIASPQLNQIFFPTDFIVEMEDEVGCSGTDTISVDVVPLIYFPTAFSPNGDKVNDTLTISLSKLRISDFNLDIFDRWGGKIFNSNKSDFKWDGKVNGQELTVGVYNYYITYIDNRKKQQKLAGTISLMR